MQTASIICRGAAALAAAAVVTLSGGAPAVAQEPVTVTVDTTNDVVDFGGAQRVADLPGPDGLTSLREATIASTNTTGPETIAFGIPTSDPGFTGEEFVIVIDPDRVPQQIAFGLEIGDDATTIDATTQPGGFAIVVEGGPQSTTDSDGGLRIASSGNQVVGLGVRGYTNGLQVDGGSNNRIVDVTATANANGITVAGRDVGTGNEVSSSTVADNDRIGVAIVNTVGVTVDGNTITGNGTEGVFMFGADEVTVTDNDISGNDFHGIEFQVESLPFEFPPDPATRGGVASGNTITGNGGDGVTVDAADRFTITQNVISGNAGLGIDLSGGRQDAFGVTGNDAKDRDVGANQRLNFPERLTATDDGAATVLEGRVDFPDPQSLTIELFANDAPDTSGHGEGETFVGTATPEANGRFTATLPPDLAGQWLTATSTDAAGNTSEFSEAVQGAGPRR
jgi:parallel beta-helix repeat protein